MVHAQCASSLKPGSGLRALRYHTPRHDLVNELLGIKSIVHKKKLLMEDLRRMHSKSPRSAH